MVKRPMILMSLLGIIVIIVACLFRFTVVEKPSAVNITSESTLLETINISELSVAEFKYRGIAEVYKDRAPGFQFPFFGKKDSDESADPPKQDLQCRICYNAIVKAGIDMKKVSFDVDNHNKIVAASLPDIDIKVTIIDEHSIAVLPSDAKIGLDDMLIYSKADAEKEARESTGLIDTARENVKAAIEGLLFPILKSEGYTLKWE